MGTCLVLVAAGLAWWREWTWGPFFYLAVALPYLSLGAAAALGLLLLARRWRRAAAVALCLIAPVGSQLPLWVGQAPPPGRQRPLTVMSINLQYGGGDTAQVVAAVRELHVDLLAVQEITPEALTRLHEQGISQTLPHEFSLPGPRAQGSAVFSRYPLSDSSAWPGYFMTNLHTQVHLPQAETLTFVVAHPAYPVTRDLWHAEAHQLRRDLAGLGPGPAIVAGDFNATVEQPTLRHLHHDGWQNVVEQAGTGWKPTWGLATDGVSLFAIDHVLTRGGPWGVGLHTLRITGSDHRAIVARLTI